MAKETYAAVLRLVDPEKNHNFRVGYTLPNTNKPTTYVWNKDNNYEVEVPTKVVYTDDFKKKVVFHENYALFLIESYGVKGKGKTKVLEFVKELKRDEFEKEAFPKHIFPEQPKEVEKEVPEVQEDSKPKGKKNEK